MRLRRDGAGTTRAEEFRKGDEQMNREKNKFAYEWNVITPAIVRKTARRGSIPSYSELATHSP